MQNLQSLITEPLLQTTLALFALVLAAWLGDVVVKRVLVRIAKIISARTPWKWDDVMVEHGVFNWFAQLVPALVIQAGIVWVPGLPASLTVFIRNLAMIAVVIVLFLALSAALSALEMVYATNAHSRTRSIKGYVQLVKLALFAVVSIITVSILIDRSPLLLLSGLGALSAVLLLVFKDTITSFAASVQLGSNDMLRIGDWIEMPQFNADGDVIDIALHTVKVRNWDKTITTIPTARLISDSYKNWRGMQETGGRRIKRSLHLDAGSVRFLDDELLQKLGRFSLLQDYLSQKQSDIEEWNASLGESASNAVNQRRLTNLGTFRAYAQEFLDKHPRIHHGLFCLVRQLDPGPNGIPLEIYAFTATTAWAEYEGIQGDIFDHLIAIAPEFGLSLYQQPSGADVRASLLAMSKA